MVLEISIHKETKPDYTYYYDAYTVLADDHRILTIVTTCNDTVSKWLNDLLKTTKNHLVVGVSVERETVKYSKGGLNDSPYHLLNLCVGSHCLIHHLSQPEQCVTPRSLRTFFDDPRVVAVGINIKSVAQNLERHHDIKIKNPMDLHSLAIQGLKRDDLDLARYNLDKLTMTVFGKHMYVLWPHDKLNWWFTPIPYYLWDRKLSLEKVQYTTIHVYLCFLLASEFLDMIDGSVGAFSSSKTKKNKKNNNK